MTTTKSNTEIILLAYALWEADQTDDGSEQWQRLAQMYKDGEVNDDDLTLAGAVSSLMKGNPMWGGSRLADRVREIAREMSAPIIDVTVCDEDGWFVMRAPDLTGARVT